MGETSRQMGGHRAGTDHSLTEEPSVSGSSPGNLWERRILDDLIERDRLIADRRLWKFRQTEDGQLARERSTFVRGASIAERAEADQHTRKEREDMDALLERERGRADADMATERRSHDRDRLGMTALSDITSAALKDSVASLARARDEHGHDQDVLAMVTHDLRSPLMIITMNARNIVETSKEPLTVDDADEVVRAAARMERLLTDLVEVARIDSGTLRIVKLVHDACALAADVLRSYQPLFSARLMTFTAELPVDGVFAPFDYDRIVQVLSNLLGNALKFTPEHGTVTLRVQKLAGAVEFVVRDSGPGIEGADLPHVFQKFWKIDSVTRRGLGLGLHICKSIVEGHGGQIRVESEVGHGAAFFFTLPLATSPAA
jgi:signal transduction histidine kinase